MSDVLIAGAGVIGLSLALELRRQGASVTVLERSTALAGASNAAAGMLAAEDPHNPSALLPLSRYSLSLYPAFLAHMEALSGQAVPLQTDITIQHTETGSHELAEHSIEPGQLGSALLAVARAAGVRIVEHTPVSSLEVMRSGVKVHTAQGLRYSAGQFAHTTGAWALPFPTGGSAFPITPRKGQMLRVAMPAESFLRAVHRAEHIYIVPRTVGPQAGSALIGATVEDAGFDLATDPTQLQQLRERAAALCPETSFVAHAPQLEAWAGLRPCTPDFLPLLGQVSEREWIAAGHFRNGILLAPGTAAVLASLLAGRTPEVDLTPFLPGRFGAFR